MIVVSDTSPISNLIQIGKLYLLQEIFNEVIIPQEVYKELSNYGDQKMVVDEQSWINIKSVENKELVLELENTIDKGEAEAIVLAKEIGANLIIIDEMTGRSVADAFGLGKIGVLGILTLAKKRKLIEHIKPIVDDLRKKAGFRISEKLYNEILRSVNEN